MLAAPGQYQPFPHQNTILCLSLVPRLANPGRKDHRLVVAGQIVVGGVDVRLVATGLADTTFQVVGDNGLGDTAVKGKRADMGADPVLKALAGGGLDIGITACTQYGDKDLSVAD